MATPARPAHNLLRQREGWAMWWAAQEVASISAAIGDCPFGRELLDLAELWTAGSRLRLGVRLLPRPFHRARV